MSGADPGALPDAASGALPVAAPPVAISPRTVIEACFSSEGRAELDTVYDVGLAVGLPEQTVRLALRRMQGEGILEQHGRGRAGHLLLTEHGGQRADRELALVGFAFAQDRGEVPWDGRWRMYGFSVPERQRAERDGLRKLLLALGAALLLPGVYVSPHDLGVELRRSVPGETLDRYLISAVLTEPSAPGCETPRDLAEHLWPAGGIDAAYDTLAAVLADPPSVAPQGPVAVTARALALLEALEAGLREDPLLPAELLPGEWRPLRLRREFVVEWEQLRSREPGLPVFDWGA